MKHSNILRSILLPFVILLVLLALFLYNRSNQAKMQKLEGTRIYLDTITSLTIYGTEDDSILEDAFSLIATDQMIFSRTAPDAELYKLNHNGQTETTVSEELRDVIRLGISYGEQTKGAFDIGIASVSSLWDFQREAPTVPSAASIQEALYHTGYQKLSLEGQKLIRSDSSVQIELGGIAKGYIADHVKQFLLSKGIKSALINLGGNILCLGTKPDGSPFEIGIESPFEDSKGTYVKMLSIDDQTVVTSGIYERCFTSEGKFYHHILDPATGYPVENDLASVTIVTDKSVDADALSTSCFVLGVEAGKELIESIENTEAIFIQKDGTVTTTKGLSD